MRPTIPLLALLIAALFAAYGAAGPARGNPPVELTLVLLTEVSNSMDNGEFEMVKAGYQAGFADPEVTSAIAGSAGGVALASVEFSDADRVEAFKRKLLMELLISQHAEAC